MQPVREQQKGKIQLEDQQSGKGKGLITTQLLNEGALNAKPNYSSRGESGGNSQISMENDSNAHEIKS